MSILSTRLTLTSALVLASIVSCGRVELSLLKDQSNQRFWQVTEPTDSSLNQAHALSRYMRAAAGRELPLRFFRELIKANASVTVVEGEWPSYQPGILYGGTISMPSSSRPESWTGPEWSSFYNELFHAWFGLIFTKDAAYGSARSKLLTQDRMDRYRKAYPSNPALAQEEAWSETVATIMIQLAPIKIDGQFKYGAYDSFVYQIGRTVAPVSHSDRPGYTPEAENIYPDAAEYQHLFEFLVSVTPPSKPAIVKHSHPALLR
jgi:hypothetical protein